MAELRQRKAPQPSSPGKKPKDVVSQKGQSISIVGILGLLSPIFIFLAAAAYILHSSDWVVSLGDILAGRGAPGSVPAIAGKLRLSDSQLRAFDGTDSSKPIYLALNGTIFDVSASPAFYGPGGHYHHFVGRDATRGWVTECWDSEDQLTWNLDGVELLYMPKYLDEQMQNAADGKAISEDAESGAVPFEQLQPQAKALIDRVGRISKKKMAQRREEDLVEAKRQVDEKINHWTSFFAGNAKYKTVGLVVRNAEKDKVEPPPLCEEARKKRPLKGGKLEHLMGASANVAQFTKSKGAEPSGRPDFVA